MASSDPVLKLLVLILFLGGLFVLASASIGLTTRLDLPPYRFVLDQMITGGILGILGLIVTLRVSYKAWRPWALGIFLASLALTVLVFLPQIGLEHGGAKRWIAIGPVNFQPSEFLKFGYLLYLSALFSARRSVWAFGFASALAGGILILQPDIGTLGVLAGSGLVLFLIAGGGWKHMFAAFFAALALLAILIYLEPYRLDRLEVFLNPNHDPQRSGYQIRQALIAIGSGGIFGQGFGMSQQKFGYLPEPMSDSIFAVAAEEFGFVGSAVLISLFLAFAWRGFSIAARAPDKFGKLLGAAIVSHIVLQAFINIAALSGLLPLTGIPLTFMSKGGSALAITLAQIGILLNISRHRT